MSWASRAVNSVSGIESMSYLELGINKKRTYNEVKAKIKVGVDFNSKLDPTYAMTTDEFFEFNMERFDIVFIDAGHSFDQVLKDYNNSVDICNKMILMHDLVPEKERDLVPEGVGDGFRLLHFLDNNGYHPCTLETDYGLTAIFPPFKKAPIESEYYDIDFHEFKRYWKGKSLSCDKFFDTIRKRTLSPVVVVSCGRTGSNVILESMRGSQELLATKEPETKTLFRNPKRLPNGFLTKCDTTYIDRLEQVDSLMDLNPDLKILWPIRDPRDVVMSKMYRGQKISDGGDNYEVSDDSSIDGALESLRKMKRICEYIMDKYPNSIKICKMEGMLDGSDDLAKEMADFCGIKYTEEIKNFHIRMRNSFKKKRYKGIDKGELKKWTRWKTEYNAFFSKNSIDLQAVFDRLSSEGFIEFFGYGD